MANWYSRGFLGAWTGAPGRNPNWRGRVLTLSVALLASTSPIANPARPQSVAPVLWTADSIRSEVLGETRRVKIALPIGYDARENALERYPVLIVLDADGEPAFTAVVANVRSLSGRSGALLPRMIVVGVDAQ